MSLFLLALVLALWVTLRTGEDGAAVSGGGNPTSAEPGRPPVPENITAPGDAPESDEGAGAGPGRAPEPLPPAVRPVAASPVLAPEAERWVRDLPGRLRAAPVSLEPGFFDALPAGPLRFELFEDVAGTAEFHARNVADDGAVSLVGSWDGDPGSIVVMTHYRGAVSGHVALPGARTYELRGVPGGALWAIEVDPASVPGCGGTPDHGAAAASEPGDGGSGDGAGGGGDAPDGTGGEGHAHTIDILVAYTDDTRSVAGGTPNAIADCHAVISLSNQRFRISGIDAELRLVHTMEISYEETGDADTDLSRLRERGDGHFDEVHLEREVHGADLVALLVRSSDYGGLAYVARNVSSDESWGFSLTLFSALQYAFTHEVGHNAGCQHDRDNAGSQPVFPYSYGHRFTGTDGTYYRTQMAYSPGWTTNYFSTPLRNYVGTPVGTATSDNARSANNLLAHLEGYRDTVPGGGSIVVADVLVDDDTSSTADGQLQPYEFAYLVFSFRNERDTAYTGVEFRVDSDDPYIDRLSSGTFTLGTVPAGATVTASDAQLIRLDRAAPEGHEVLVSVTLTSGPEILARYVALPVGQTPIALRHLSVEVDERPPYIVVSDGFLDPGEDVDCRLWVENYGVQRSTVTEATVRTASPYIAMNDAEVSFTSVGAGVQKRSLDHFGFFVSSFAPLGTRIVFDVDYTSVQGFWTDSFVLSVGAHALELRPVTIDDDRAGGSVGNGDGIVQPGEVLELSLAVRNTGVSAAWDTEGVLASPSPHVLVIGETESYGNVGPGGSEVARTFLVSVLGSAPVGAPLPFTLTATAEEGQWPLAFSLPVAVPTTGPATPEVAVAGPEGSDLVVTLPQTHGGMTYHIEWSATLGAWSPLEAVAGTGAPVVRTYPAWLDGRPGGHVRVRRTMP